MRGLVLLLVSLLLAGCASAPQDVPSTPTATTQGIAVGEPNPSAPSPSPTSPTASPSPSPTPSRDVSASGVRHPGEAQWTLDCQARGHQNWRTQETLTVLDTDPRTLYVAVEYIGPLVSKDDGATWREIPRGITGYARMQDPSRPCLQEFGRIVVDPSDAQHLLLSRVDTPGTLLTPFSENAGVWETRDGGKTWTQMLDDWMDASGSRAIAFAPSNPKVIYHGVNGMPASYGGADPEKLFVTKGIAYRSEDAGGNWTELPTGLVKGMRASDVLVDPADADHALLAVFAQDPSTGGLAAEQPGILETRDGGKTWTSLAGGLPAGSRAIIHLDAAPTAFGHLFVVPQIMQGRPLAYASLDGGATWKEASRAPEIVAYDPHDAAGLHLYGASRFEQGLLESRDGGLTWESVGAFPSGFTPMGETHLTKLVVDPDAATTLYMAGDEAKVWRSTDAGKTWTTLLDLAKAQAADAAYAP